MFKKVCFFVFFLVFPRKNARNNKRKDVKNEDEEEERGNLRRGSGV